MSPAALLLAAALLVQEADPVEPGISLDNDGEFGWGCSAPVAIGGYKGGVWRYYGKKRSRSSYHMQLRRPVADPRYTINWNIGPDSGSEAFRKGPGAVRIDFEFEPKVVAGPLRVQLWGDSIYAGARTIMSARKARRYYGKDQPASTLVAYAGSSQIARLASARTWTAVAVDGAGNRLASETFEVPTPRQAEAAFREARAKIDRVEQRFAVNHEPLTEDGVECTDQENPIASI